MIFTDLLVKNLQQAAQQLVEADIVCLNKLDILIGEEATRLLFDVWDRGKEEIRRKADAYPHPKSVEVELLRAFCKHLTHPEESYAVYHAISLYPDNAKVLPHK
jgi:G3E family GTPase